MCAREHERSQDISAAFHALVEGVREGAAVVSLDRKILTCNSRLAELLKAECPAMLGQSLLPLVIPEDQPRLEELFQSFPEDFRRIQVRLSSGNTPPLPVELAIKTVGTNGTRAFSVLVTDQSRRRRAQDALRRSEERFSKAFYASPIPIAITGLQDARVFDANASFFRLFGYTEAEMLSHTTLELNLWADPSDRPRLTERLGMGKPVHAEPVALRTRSGEIRNTLVSMELIEVDDQRCSLCSVQAVTERQRAEEEVRRLNAELEQRVADRTAELAAERSRWQGIVEGIADEVWVCNVEGKMSLINLPAVTHMGLDEFEDKTIAEVYEEVDILNPDGQLRPLDEAPLLRALRGEIVRGEEIMRHRGTGRTRNRQYSAAPMRDASGAITGSVAIVRDVTEYQAAQDRIRQLNQDLERRTQELASANQELEAFAYSVSHDLRMPLASLTVLTRLLLDDYRTQLPSAGQGAIDLIHENAVEMGKLIDGLLNFSRLSRQPLKTQMVDMKTLVQVAWASLGPQRTGRQVEFVVADLPTGQGDPLLLKQVLVNLLSNALKFTRSRELARIEVGHQTGTDGKVVYLVRDNGVGFDNAQTEKLFRAFQRLHPDDEYEGTGIGLATVQRIIKRHGGNVSAEGQVNQGATFYFTLG